MLLNLFLFSSSMPLAVTLQLASAFCQIPQLNKFLI